MKRPLTPLEIAAEATGLPIHRLARQMAEPGATPKQRLNVERRLKRVLKNGGTTEKCSDHYVERLASLLGIVGTPLHDLLLKPRYSWPPWALDGSYRGELRSVSRGTPRSVTRGPGKASAVTGAGPVAAGARTTALSSKSTRREKSRATPNRLTVLEAV